MQKYKMPIRLRIMVCLIGMLLPMCMFAQQITVQGVVRPDRRNRYRCQCGAEEHNERYDNGYRWRFLAECAFGCRYSSFIRGL